MVANLESQLCSLYFVIPVLGLQKLLYKTYTLIDPTDHSVCFWQKCAVTPPQGTD